MRPVEHCINALSMFAEDDDVFGDVLQHLHRLAKLDRERPEPAEEVLEAAFDRLQEALSRAAVLRTEDVHIWAPDACALLATRSSRKATVQIIMDAIYPVIDKAPWGKVAEAIKAALASQAALSQGKGK